MGLSLKKLNNVWSGLDFWDKKENQQQRKTAAQAPPQQQAPVRAPMRAGFRATPQRANAPQPVRKPVVFRASDPVQIGELNVNKPMLPQGHGPDPVGRFVAPIGDALKGAVQATGQVVRTPYDIGKTVPASLTNNKVALKNANAQADKDVQNLMNMVRFVPRAGIQLAESLPSPIVNRHPSKNEVKPKGPASVLLGKEPIPSLQKQYKDTVKSKGKAAAAGEGVATAIGDALALKGGKASITKGIGKTVEVAPKVSAKAAPVLKKVNEPFGAVGPAAPKPAKVTPQPAGLAKPSKPKLGMTANQNLDSIVNSHVDNSGEGIKPRNAVVRFTTQAQEKLYRAPIDRARDKANEAIMKGITSDNSMTSKATAVPTLVSNRFGMKDSVRNIIRSRNGTQENAGRTFMNLSKDMNERYSTLTPEGQDKLTRYFFDKDTVKALHSQGHVSAPKKVPYNQLSPDEKTLADQLMHINKHTNNANLVMGKIDKDQHKLGAAGRHTPRIFDFQGRTQGNAAGRASLIDTGVGRKRKDISKFSPEVIAQMEKNPVLAILARSETAIRDQATHDAMQSLKKEGLIRSKAPKNNKNFDKLDGPQYGKYNGHYIYKPVRSEIDGHLRANTDWGQAVTEMIDMYQNSKLGSADRFFKSTKTTLSPGTFLGNIVSNPVAFNSASGVNALQQAGNMAGASGRLIKDAHGKFDRGLYEARKQGVAVNDTGRQLTGDRRKEFLGTDSTKRTKNPAKIAGHAYGGVDQAAQLALYTELRRRGLDQATAARRAQIGTQDYGGVGRGVQNLADSPILGKPFARFTPELLRLIKNNLVYNPVGTAVKATGVVAAGTALSHASGETPQERAAREGATGQTQIPGTGFINKAVSHGEYSEPLGLNFAIPGKKGKDNGASVNIARLTGLNYPIDPGGDAKSGLLNQLSPFAIPLRRDAQGNQVFAPAEAVSSLTLRPIADQIANRDFMGRSISDPNNKTYIEGVGDKGKKFVSNLSAHDKANNRLRTALSGYAPLFNEIYSGKSAAQGKPDYYGKERTPAQAGLRALGLKVESNKKEVRQGRMDTQQYFEGRVAQVNDFLNKHPDLKDAYAKVQSKTVDRKNNTRVNDIISPEKWSILKAHPELFGQLKTEAEYDNQHSKNAKGMGKPVDPIYKLGNTGQVKDALNLRAQPTGDDQEREEILKATAPWYQKFKKDEAAYFDANDQYYANLKKTNNKNPPKTNPRVEEYNNVKYPEQAPVVQKYYQTKDGSTAAGKAFYKANAKELNKAFATYKDDQLAYTNKKRAIEGFDPIPKSVWDSVTFGYETDDKAAKELASKGGGYSSSRRRGGSRRGGGSSSGEDDPNSHYVNPYKYTVKSKGRTAKPKVTIRKAEGSTKPAGRPKGKAKVAFKITKSKV